MFEIFGNNRIKFNQILTSFGFANEEDIKTFMSYCHTDLRLISVLLSFRSPESSEKSATLGFLWNNISGRI